jgi:hypothetical protein
MSDFDHPPFEAKVAGILPRCQELIHISTYDGKAYKLYDRYNFNILYILKTNLPEFHFGNLVKKQLRNFRSIVKTNPTQSSGGCDSPGYNLQLHFDLFGASSVSFCHSEQNRHTP